LILYIYKNSSFNLLSQRYIHTHGTTIHLHEKQARCAMHVKGWLYFFFFLFECRRRAICTSIREMDSYPDFVWRNRESRL